jgi:hypothetical protein
MFAIMISLWNSQTTYYAHAAVVGVKKETKAISPLFEKKAELFVAKSLPTAPSVKQAAKVIEKKQPALVEKPKALPVVVAGKIETVAKPVTLFENYGEIDNQKTDSQSGAEFFNVLAQDNGKKKESNKLAQMLYEMVGETPIKQMIPFISERDDRVAAFLVGIAKKESSFGEHVPTLDGQDCFNYWGYKGVGERGTGMGYACFASAEEAIKVVGNRLEVLVNKERNTPARMVDTWKCGRSCAGDPGAPGWTSTVAIYFNQIVNHEG